MTFSPEQIEQLNQKLDPIHVRPPSKFGPKGDYIEGWHAIAEANRIFGFDGWSYRIVDISECHKPYQNEKQNWSVSFIARVEVTAGGVIREDIGYGSGHAKQIGDAYEGATKEAITDALKRALRTFGNPFGLALYDKSRANVAASEASTQSGTDKPQAKKVSAAEMKRGLETITQELLDCRTPNDCQKLWKAWREVFQEQNWSRDYIDVAKDRIQARGRELKEAEAEDVFPGDAPANGLDPHQHPIMAG